MALVFDGGRQLPFHAVPSRIQSMNGLPEEEFLEGEEPQTLPEEGAHEQIQEQVEEQQPLLSPETPIKPLAEAKARLEEQLKGFKAFTAELESTHKRLARTQEHENEILEGGATANEEEQLGKLSRVLALKKVLERKLERSQESGSRAAAAQLACAVKEALHSLWHDLAHLRAKREKKHLATLKKLVGDEEQWPWAIEHAKTLMRHFADVRAIDRLGESADFSLSHGATQHAADSSRRTSARWRPRRRLNTTPERAAGGGASVLTFARDPSRLQSKTIPNKSHHRPEMVGGQSRKARSSFLMPARPFCATHSLTQVSASD
jgi:hypothetical protein